VAAGSEPSQSMHQHTVAQPPAVKRSASVGAVLADDVNHASSFSRQPSAVNQPATANSAAGLRYVDCLI